MSETITAVLLIILGWLFGLLTPVITNHLHRVREGKEVSRALRIELSELKYRLAVGVYRINMHFGTVDRALLEWLQPLVTNYSGVNPFKKIRDSINMQLKLSDDQIQNLTEFDRADVGSALSLKKHMVPLLEIKYALVSMFDTALQNQLIELRNNLNILNDEVDQANYYFKLTFESNLSPDNRQNVDVNLDSTYKRYSVIAKKIVNQLDSILWK